MMNLVSVRIPREFVEIIDEMVLMGKYATRSECIRLALRDFYRGHFAHNQNYEFKFPTTGSNIYEENVIFEDE
ncbi:MAG: ribbon-helix-helix domain-containing protein [Candidatus Heimdallarchaeaceae archaeon]